MTAAARVLAVALAAALAGACARPAPPPIGAAGQPFAPGPEERDLLARGRAEEDRLLARVRPYEDPALAEYLAGLAAGLGAAEIARAGGPAIRVVVLRDPALNAFALPHGAVIVHTGLLAALEHEAGLAAILAREIAHVARRHALREPRERPWYRGHVERPPLRAVGLALGARAARDAGAAAVFSPVERAIFGSDLALSALGSLEGYGERLEREADRAAAGRLAAAGHDVREARAALVALAQQARGRGGFEVFLLGDPDWIEDRAECLARQAIAPASGRAPGRAGDFERITRAVVRDNALLDAQAGRLDLAERQLARALALAPGDAVAHVHLGDLHRLRAQRADAPAEAAAHLERARAAYERALALDPAYPDAYRQLGLLRFQQGDTAGARAAFERYLALAPDAPDAARIREYAAALRADPL